MVRAQGTASRTAALNAALRRGLLLTIVLVIFGAVAGTLVGQRMSTVSTATATILVNPLDGNPFSTKGSGDDLINLETEAQLVRSDGVTSMVKEKEPTSESLDEIRSGLAVDVPANTQILKIAYSSRDATESLTRAQLFADQYLLYRENRAKELVANQTRRIEEQIDARTKEQTALAKQVGGKPANSQTNVQRVQLEAVSTQINQLRARSAELQSTGTNPGLVVTPATIPPAGLLGSWLAYTLAGAFGGLMIAVGIALLRSRADNRIRHVDDISTAGQILLGEVPLRDVTTSQDLVHLGSSAQLALPESFKDLRVSLLTTEHRRPAVVVITTASVGEARPLVTAGLALATSASNLRTVVIEAVDSQLIDSSPENRGGLAAVLDGRTSLVDSLVPIRPHLDVLPSGDTLGVDDLFMAPEMRELINSLRETADLIFLVTSNVHDPRSKALVDLADSVILEAVQGVSSYRDLYRASTDYTLVAEKLLGVVYVSNVRSRGAATETATSIAQDPDESSSEAPYAQNSSPSTLDDPDSSNPIGAGPNEPEPAVGDESTADSEISSLDAASAGQEDDVDSIGAVRPHGR